MATVHKILRIIILILLVAVIVMVISFKISIDQLDQACFVNGDAVACDKLANQTYFQFTNPETGAVITPQPPSSP